MAPSPPPCDDPIRVAVANDYEVVVRGVGAMLEDDHRIEVVVLVADAPLPADSHLDVVLYDTFGTAEVHAADVERILGSEQVGRAVVFTDRVEPFLVEAARAAGMAGYLAKGVSAKELVDALEAVCRGEFVVVDSRQPAPETDEASPQRRWPGQLHEITEREANVLALIVQGRGNDEIAERLYIAPDTVKSRVRSLYRKIGVETRAQAVAWGMRNGFDPDHRILWQE